LIATFGSPFAASLRRPLSRHPIFQEKSRPLTSTTRNYTPPARPVLTSPTTSFVKKRVLTVYYAVIGVLSRPAYAIPLLLNVTGSVWFFILIGKAELSLTVPITNSLAFLFTVVGEWWAEGKVISRGTSKGS
jgi:hypothetical protein